MSNSGEYLGYKDHPLPLRKCFISASTRYLQ